MATNHQIRTNSQDIAAIVARQNSQDNDMVALTQTVAKIQDHIQSLTVNTQSLASNMGNTVDRVTTMENNFATLQNERGIMIRENDAAHASIARSVEEVRFKLTKTVRKAVKKALDQTGMKNDQTNGRIFDLVKTALFMLAGYVLSYVLQHIHF